MTLQLLQIRSGPRAALTAGDLAATYQEVPTMAEPTSRRLDAYDRLMARVDKRGDGCWVFTGKPNRGGYSQVDVAGRAVIGHRLVWEHLSGSLTSDVVLHHECRNRLCVNPKHLQPMTANEHAVLHRPVATACRQCGSTALRYYAKSRSRHCLACDRRRSVAAWQKTRAARADVLRIRAYCLCGAVMFASSNRVAATYIYDWFREVHTGDGCGPASREEANRARRRKDYRAVPRAERRTHCIHGHPFVADARLTGRGFRVCGECAQGRIDRRIDRDEGDVA